MEKHFGVLCGIMVLLIAGVFFAIGYLTAVIQFIVAAMELL